MSQPKTGPKVIFVCHGNICRSPMAEMIARQWAKEAGIEATFSSAGVSSEEVGNPIDPRAAKVLKAHGYQVDPHSPHRVTAAEILDADLVIASESWHITQMSHIAPSALNLSLISDYNPEVAPGTPLPDPWYGGPEDFEDTLAAIEAAMPGIMDRIQRLPR